MCATEKMGVFSVARSLNTSGENISEIILLAWSINTSQEKWHKFISWRGLNVREQKNGLFFFCMVYQYLMRKMA